MQINAEKIEDTRKCFLIKQWINKTKDNQGVTQSFLHWKVEHYSYQDLIDAYITQLNFLLSTLLWHPGTIAHLNWQRKIYYQVKFYLCMTLHKIICASCKMSHRGCIGNISMLHCIPLWLIMYALMKVATKW